MLTRRVVALLVSVLMIAAVIAGCAPAAEPKKPAEPAKPVGISLVIRGRNDILNMDVPFHGGHEDGMIYPLIYSRLVYVLPDAPEKLLPDLATKWEISPDASVYTFTLRQGAKFHKGYGEVTAKDVVWTFNRIKDPKVGTGFSGEWTNVKEIVAVDNYTVKITLIKPDPTFAHFVLNRSGFVQCQKAIAEKGQKYTSDAVGSGPYIFESWTPGDKVVLVKNKDNWLHKGNVDRIIARGIVDDKVAELAIEAGDLNLAYIAVPEVQRSIISKGKVSTIVKPAGRSVFMTMSSNKNRPTQDQKFREALAISIDRKLLVDKFMDGLGAPAHSLINPECYGYSAKEYFKYDPARAKELLKQVKLPADFKLDFITRTDTGDMATAIQSMWQGIGLKVQLTVLESAIMFERRDQKKYDIMLYSQSRDYPEGFLPTITLAGDANNVRLYYDGVESLVADLAKQNDVATRAQTWVKIQDKLGQDVPIIPVVFPVNVVAMRKDIQPFPIVLWRYPMWLIKVGQ
ncbi:MAG: ABC transporter substrate-binding protein [Bacillota bacterium]|nr:ABC transporter substrate-binding protein [Bacillota bacterium]